MESKKCANCKKETPLPRSICWDCERPICCKNILEPGELRCNNCKPLWIKRGMKKFEGYANARNYEIVIETVSNLDGLPELKKYEDLIMEWVKPKELKEGWYLVTHKYKKIVRYYAPDKPKLILNF